MRRAGGANAAPPGTTCATPRAQALPPDPAVEAARRRNVPVIDLTRHFLRRRGLLPGDRRRPRLQGLHAPHAHLREDARPRTYWTRSAASLASMPAIRCLAAAHPRCSPSRRRPRTPSKTMEIGLQDDAVFVAQVGISRQAALDRAVELGVTTIRANMLWSRVMSRAGRAHDPPRQAGLRLQRLRRAGRRGARPWPRRRAHADRPGARVGDRGQDDRHARPVGEGVRALDGARSPSTTRAGSAATASGTSRTGTRG